MPGFYPCKTCKASLPVENKHSKCTSCLGPEHAKEALVNCSFSKFCASFFKCTLEKRLSHSSTERSVSLNLAQSSSTSPSGRQAAAPSPHGSVPRWTGQCTRESSTCRKPSSQTSSSFASPPLREEKESPVQTIGSGQQFPTKERYSQSYCVNVQQCLSPWGPRGLRAQIGSRMTCCPSAPLRSSDLFGIPACVYQRVIHPREPRLVGRRLEILSVVTFSEFLLAFTSASFTQGNLVSLVDVWRSFQIFAIVPSSHVNVMFSGKSDGQTLLTVWNTLQIDISHLKILFVAGLSFVIGLERTFKFFFQKHKMKATGFFLGGVFIVLIGWPVVGMVLEIYGFFLLFRGFFPVAVGFIRRVPVLGYLLNLPGISSGIRTVKAYALALLLTAAFIPQSRSAPQGHFQRRNWSPQAMLYLKGALRVASVIHPSPGRNGHLSTL
ncbi:UNVERIFIED_CONTAM: hypothetical protein FKN15_006929 [Acipenser sinensis]